MTLIAGSILGAVIEEAGFRGYLRTRLSKSMSTTVAIVVIALVISPAHGLTQGFMIPVLGWYFMTDVVFGALSWLSTSIVPGIMVHAVGLFAFLAFIWPTDRLRQQSSLPTIDPVFWIELGLFAILALLSVIAFYNLAVSTSRERRPEPV